MLGRRLVAGAGLDHGRSDPSNSSAADDSGPYSSDRSAEVESFLTRTHLPLRERTLWRMLYETAARTEEILALDVAELDLRNRRAKVRRKGGAADVIVLRTATARLLPFVRHHINMLGRYSFLTPDLAPGGLRPLCDPSDSDEEDSV